MPTILHFPTVVPKGRRRNSITALRAALALSFLLAFLSPSFAQTGAPEVDPSAVTLTVHVSTEGNDGTGTGSAAAPFRTINPYDIFEAGTGFVRNDLSGGFTHHAAGSGVGGGIRQDMLRIYQQGEVVATATDTLTYEPDTWYEIEVRLILADATTATRLAATAYARGSSGTAPRQLLATVEAENVTIGNNGVNAATFFSGFSGGNNTGANLIALDNWSIFQVH